MQKRKKPDIFVHFSKDSFVVFTRVKKKFSYILQVLKFSKSLKPWSTWKLHHIRCVDCTKWQIVKCRFYIIFFFFGSTWFQITVFVSLAFKLNKIKNHDKTLSCFLSWFLIKCDLKKEKWVIEHMFTIFAHFYGNITLEEREQKFSYSFSQTVSWVFRKSS